MTSPDGEGIKKVEGHALLDSGGSGEEKEKGKEGRRLERERSASNRDNEKKRGSYHFTCHRKADTEQISIFLLFFQISNL